MGGLTSNRKRGGDSLTSLRYTASPNYYIPFKIDTPLDLHSSKKQKVSSMHLNPDSRVSSPSISSHQSTFSRIRQYPDPVKPLKSVHAPCRNSKFFSAKMGGLFSKLQQARAAAVSSFRYVNVDKSEKAVEVDLEKAVEVDLVSDEEAEEVIVWGKPERKSVETIETVETDEDVILKEKYRILANNDGQVSSSAVSDLSIQTTSKAENRVVQEADELPYKTLYASVQGRDRKLSHLSFDIGLLTKKLSGFWRSAKKKPEKDLREETLTPLTDEEETEVSRALANSNRRKLLVTHSDSNIEITGQVLQCLRPGAWLNDEVINLYLELLKEREKREPQKFLKCHFFNTFFYKKLISGKGGYDFKAVRRWTTQRKIGYGLIECDKIFVPIHKEIHWCLAIINKKDQKFQYLDSLKGRDSKVLQVLAKYYADEVKEKSEKDIDVESWKLEYVTDLPAQENGFDCGMFMIKYADFYSRGLGLCFGQENMPYFRRRTAKEILRLRAE